jgi:hypothetical protein
MMSRVFLTGDTHGGCNNGMDMRKLSSKEFPEGKGLTRDDYVIILGDFGFIWSREETRDSIYWRTWMQNKPWTTLFLDGNHENHEMLSELPQVPMFCATVGVAYGNMYHLKRGEVYDIAGKLFFTMGGAASVDKETRVNRISWWEEETPSWSEFEYGLTNLEAYDNKVDYILSHTLPKTIADIYRAKKSLDRYTKDPTESFLDTIISAVGYKHQYCGHWHDDATIHNSSILYKKVIEIV